MTKKEIFERRAELEEHVSNSYAAYLKANEDNNRATGEIAPGELKIANARKERAKGILGSDVDEAESHLAGIHTRLAEIRIEGDSAKLAWDESQEQLTAFLREHFDTFAEHATKLSEAAEEGLQKANRAVMFAGDKWRQAREAWEPLCRAAQIRRPPDFPLVGGENIAARPPQLELAEQSDAA